MKTCDEMVKSLFERREEYLAEQKIKRRNAVISTALYGCAFAVIAGVGVWISGKVSQKPITGDSSLPSSGSAADSSVTATELPIKWATTPGNYGDIVDDMDGIIEWNGKQISGRLWGALDEGGEDCLYAVEARYFPVDEQFVYNGKTLAQYEAEHNEKTGKLETGFIIKRLLEAADSMEIENGDKISNDIYDKLVSYIEERINKPDIEEKISEYIVDGVFVKDKAVQYTTKAEEEWKAAVQAENQAQKAFRAHFYKEVGKQLEAKGIRNEFIYEDTNPEDFLNSGFVSDYLLLFISKEDFANLTLDNMSDWIFCHAYNNTERLIKWAEEEKIDGDYVSSYFAEWNGKQIHNRLWDALEKDKTDNSCLFAVRAWRNSIDEQFVYNGKTLAQYKAELDAKWNKLDSKRYITIRNLLSITYAMQIENGDRVSKDTYDKIVKGISGTGEDISEYIVDGVFLKDKAEQEITKARKEVEDARQSYDLGCAACEDHMYEELLEQLDAQGIKYEQSKDSDNLLMFISKDDFANLTFDNMSDWSFYHAFKKSEIPIVWYNGNIYTEDIMTVFGNKDINSSLFEFCFEEQNDCLYAIEAGYCSIDKQFVYNGKTLGEYEADLEAQERKVDALNILLKEGEYLINNKDSYPSMSPEAKKYYDDTIADIGEDLMSEYIVNGVFLKDKASQDFAQAQEDWGTAQRTYYDQACSAYRAYVYEKTAKQLEAQGIKCVYSSDPDYLLLFISRDDFAKLELDNMSNWFFEHASKEIYVDIYRRIGGYTLDDLPVE